MTTLERNIGVCLRFIAACDDESRRAAAQEAREILEDDSFVTGEPVGVREVVEDLLTRAGIPCHLSGYRYLACAITMAAENPEIMRGSVTSVLYPKVAEVFNVAKWANVERAIRHVIAWTFSNTGYDELVRLFGNSISKDNGCVTNSQFIATLAKEVRRQVYGG